MNRLAVLLLVLPAFATPELWREEVFNYRVEGKLPPGWKQRPGALVWSYAIDGIPHAYVHFVRQRLKGQVDVEAQLRKRLPHYLFPGSAKDASGTFSKTTWAGYPAVRVEHTAKQQGVVSQRRVTALCVRHIWYELIETVYGEADERCREGLAVFREGFRLLTRPVTTKAQRDTSAQIVRDPDLGFVILKPKGFSRIDLDPGQDPGCRVAFQAHAGDPSRHMRVRLFEYGVRAGLDADEWMRIFFGDFGRRHRQPHEETLAALPIQGATLVAARRFTGQRDDIPVRTLVVLARTKTDRVFVLRIRTQAGAHVDFEAQIKAILGSLALS